MFDIGRGAEFLGDNIYMYADTHKCPSFFFTCVSTTEVNLCMSLKIGCRSGTNVD